MFCLWEGEDAHQPFTGLLGPMGTGSNLYSSCLITRTSHELCSIECVSVVTFLHAATSQQPVLLAHTVEIPVTELNCRHPDGRWYRFSGESAGDFPEIRILQ